MFCDLSLHHTVRSSNATRAEQNSPTVYVSIIKHKINKMSFCRPAIEALSFRNPFSDKSAQMFSSNKIYNLLIL